MNPTGASGGHLRPGRYKNRIFALRAANFFACMGLGDADFLAAGLAKQINDGRLSWCNENAAALRAFAPLARVFVRHTELMTALVTVKPNHKAFSLSLSSDSSVLRLWRPSGPHSFITHEGSATTPPY